MPGGKLYISERRVLQFNMRSWQMVFPDRVFEYLLKILNVPAGGELQDRISRNHHEILNLSRGLKISSWVSSLASSKWGSMLAPEAVEAFDAEYRWGKDVAGSILLQVREIAGILEDSNIRGVFIKGSAALVRGFLPFGSRNMGDIDILVSPGDAGKFISSLEENGYREIPGDIRQVHHYPSLTRENAAVPVEVHIAAYPVLPDENAWTSEIIQNSREIDLFGRKLLVPDDNDHAWILIRTDPFQRPYIPRIRDIVELDGMLESGAAVSFDVLRERAGQDRIPGIAEGIGTGLEYFTGRSLPGYPVQHNPSWESWSIYSTRKCLRSVFLASARERFTAFMFYPGKGVASKWEFFKWMTRSILYIDRFVPGTDKPPSWFEKSTRLIKILAGLPVAGIEYAVVKKKKF
jgi:hypothetical protein